MNTKAIVIMMMFVVAGFVVPSLAYSDPNGFRTVGVYDPCDLPFENNVGQSGTFDSGTGGATALNVLVVADVQSGGAYDIGVEFALDWGGVVNFEGATDPNLDGQIIHAEYGYGGDPNKTVDITGTDGTLKISHGESNERRPISGNDALDKGGTNDFHFDIGVTVGVAYEHVVVFGGTLIDKEDDNLSPNVTATFSDGSTVTSTAPMTGNPGLDHDTFFGFVAPDDTYIVSVHFNVSDYTYMDDLVFVTEIINASIDAGPDQRVPLYDAMAGVGVVVMDANVVNPHTFGGYTYAWTSDPATGVVFSPSAAVEDPTVTFTDPNVYVLTVVLTGGEEGANSSDVVTIDLFLPTVDAGPDQAPSSGESVSLDSTIIEPLSGEVYTYTWSSDPAWTSITENGTTAAADPCAVFTGVDEYVVTLNVSGSIYGSLDPVVTLVPDTVTFFVVADSNWVGATGVGLTGGVWDTAANWDPSGVPGTARNAGLGNESDVAAYATTIVNASAAVSVYGIKLANDPCYPYTLNVIGGAAVTTEMDFNIGSQDTGTVNVLGASEITIGNQLVIGEGADGVGAFIALAGSTVDIINESLVVGVSGQGTFTMTGGSLNVGNDIDVSTDDGGTGTMTLDNVAVTCDDLYVASDSDDAGGTGDGTVTITNNPGIVIADDLIIGRYGTGTLTSTGGYIDVNGDIEIGMSSTGTVTLNNTNITTASGDANAKLLRVGDQDGGNGRLIMNGTSVVITAGDDARIGGWEGNGTGTLEMNGTSILRIEYGNKIRKLRLGYSNGTGIIEMNDTSYLYVDDDLFAGGQNSGSATVTMTGGTFYVDNKTYFGGRSPVTGDNNTWWSPGDNTHCRLTMSGNALFYSEDKFHFGNESDPDKVGDLDDRNELIMSGNAKISVRDGEQDMFIAENAGSYVYVEINNIDNEIKCEDLEIGKDGGGCDFDIEYGKLDIKDHFKVAHSVENNSSDEVNIVIDNNARIIINNSFRIGGEGAKVEITFKDGLIDMEDSDDAFSMPHSGPSEVGGYAIFHLGKDANDVGTEKAQFKIDGPVESDYAGENDYIDFLGGGLLQLRTKVVTEQAVKDRIISGYFRTTYGTVEAHTDLDGVVPGEGEVFRVVYRESGAGGEDPKWKIELGIGSICAAGSSTYDLNSDCYIDIVDLRLLAMGWLTTYDLTDFAGLAAEWGTNGPVFGQ